jgi:cytochrome c-type biogenesis protein CcmF
MIPELGQFSLILALLLAALLGTLPLIGAQRRIGAWMALARPLAAGQFVFIAFAFACLAMSFVANDFSVLNVATNSNSQLPLQYRIAATWGSHEGSMLLWVLMLGGWTAAVAAKSRHLPDEMVARVLGVMGLIAFGFVLFLLLTSNPFERPVSAGARRTRSESAAAGPGDGVPSAAPLHGLRRLLGGVLVRVAALIGGRLDATWARWSRPWTTLAWSFLTCGIMLGSAWAYYELGWGGWWFWDPVENASFMPWLVGTALIHSLAVTEKRGTFKAWTVLLAICAFSLSLLGTFLVRSGVLTSVHAFATDPRRGVFILAFLALVIGGSLALFALRAPKVGGGGRFDPVSRETMLLANNVLLIAAAGSVLLGTLYPLFLDALNLGKISVGPPYFDTVFVPLMTPAVFLMGVGPLARWKRSPLPELWRQLRWAAAVSSRHRARRAARSGQVDADGELRVAARVLDRRLDDRQSARARPRRARRRPRAARAPAAQLLGNDRRAPRHRGVHRRRDDGQGLRDRARRADGGRRHDRVGGFKLRFDGTTEVRGPNYSAMRGGFDVSRNGEHVTTLNPEKRLYNASGQPMTEAAIENMVTGDLYVSLGEPVDGGAWSVRVYHKPFVTWIWAGCLLMALGGLLALSDRRYRASSRRDGRRVASGAAVRN